MYADKIKQPPTLLHNMMDPLFMLMWDMDEIDLINPKTSIGIVSFQWLLIVSLRGSKQSRMRI